jgi:ParB-like chromosome segregation protein Spo0J
MTPTLLILVRKAAELLRPALADRKWRRVAELQALIPDDLAEARCAATSPVAYAELPDPKEFGRAALTAEALKALGCETRGQGNKQDARLDRVKEPEADPPTEEAAPQPARAVKETVQAANETAPAAVNVSPAAGPAALPPDWPVVKLPIAELRVHPVAAKMPRMRADEWGAFRASVLANGVGDPITVQKGNVVLDGRHRFEAARERGDQDILAHVVDLSEDEQVALIYRSVIHRRHLSDDQRAMLAQELAKVEAARSKQERARKGGKAGGRSRGKASRDSSAPPGGAELTADAQAPSEPRTPRAQERAAEDFNLSKKKVARAAALAAADPKLADKVRAGETSLAEAHKELRARAEEERPAAAEPQKASPERKLAATLTRFANEARLTMPWPPDPSVLAQVLYHEFGAEGATRLHDVLGELIRTEGRSPGTRRVAFGTPRYFWQGDPPDPDPEGPRQGGPAIEPEGRSAGLEPVPAAAGNGEAGEGSAQS